MININEINYPDLFYYNITPEDMVDLQDGAKAPLVALLTEKWSQGVVVGCEILPVSEMTVKVMPGLVILGSGKVAYIKEEIELEIPAAHATLKTIHRIEARLDIENGRTGINKGGTVVTVVKKIWALPVISEGVAGESANETSLNHISLGLVSVPSLATEVTSAEIDLSCFSRDFAKEKDFTLSLDLGNEITAFQPIPELKLSNRFRKIVFDGAFYRKTDLGSKVGSITLMAIYNEESDSWVAFPQIQGEAGHGLTFAFNQSNSTWEYKSSDLAGAGYESKLFLKSTFIWR